MPIMSFQNSVQQKFNWRALLSRNDTDAGFVWGCMGGITGAVPPPYFCDAAITDTAIPMAAAISAEAVQADKEPKQSISGVGGSGHLKTLMYAV